MNFATAEFLAFLVVVVLATWALPWHRARKLLLLATSYYFYACWDARFLGLILLSTAIDFLAGMVMAHREDPRTRRTALIVSLVANLGILATFKYADFFAESLAALARSIGLSLGSVELEIILPVGISFFTFQSMSYTIDLYLRRMRPCRDPFDFALFVGFFPQLVAGPIVRAAHFLPQLESRPRWSTPRFARGVERIALGLAKKVVVADTLALVVDPVFAQPGSYGLLGSWLGLLAFSVQIYCDFSGYSDIAIGTGWILGYDLPENFRHPYRSRSPQEFWRRWHISLSTWLRDYLYIPLGGSRHGESKTSRNLMITMLLGGLWHGASWNFVVWGGWHGLLLVLQRRMKSPLPSAWRNSLGLALTFLAVAAGWVLFRADGFGDAVEFYGALVGLHGFASGAPLRWSATWILLIPIASHLLSVSGTAWNRLQSEVWFRAARLTGAVLGITTFWRADPGAFIYFQF